MTHFLAFMAGMFFALIVEDRIERMRREQFETPLNELPPRRKRKR